MAGAERSGGAVEGISPRRSILLYVAPRSSTFIQRDVAGLAAHYDVRFHELLKGPKWMLPLRLLGQLGWLLAHSAWKRDVICHFSGYHAVLPSLLAKRCFIILAGSDCACIPGIKYGNHARALLGWATSFAAGRATRLLPVHASLMSRTSHYAVEVPPHQGILAFAPRTRTPWTEVPYGFDDRFWRPDPAIPRAPDLFVCVAGPAAPNNRIHQLKGVDLLLRIAQQVPHARFHVVGLSDPDAYPDAPANVAFSGRVAPEALLSIYRGASFYVQLSLSEGMPNALCEAMLCGCIPLVSNVASMPAIIEDSGKVLERRDASMGAALCTGLLSLAPDERATLSARARAHISRHFSAQRRITSLVALLGNTT